MEMTTFRFEYLLSLVPAALRKRVESLCQVEQRPDAHPEGDVLTHVRIVTNRLARFNDPLLSWCAFFHDIGKDETTKLSDNGILQAIGHELVSADLVTTYREFISQFCDPDDVHFLVINHMRVKGFEDMSAKKQMELAKHPMFGRLIMFRTADDMKTLTDVELKRSETLTLEKIKKIEPGVVFAKGVIKLDSIYPNAPVRWVAKMGYVHDWVIYYDSLDKDNDEILRTGNKLTIEDNIKYLVPCTQEALGAYRF